MMSSLPRYDNPPVSETVLGAQFAPLEGFSTAHAGRFWTDHLGPEWVSVSETHRLADQFERFGKQRVWGPVGLSVRSGYEPGRVQIIREDDERLIQIQNSRFIYNWRKRKQDYPSYGKLLPEFKRRFAEFCEFASSTKLGDVSLNQWEVTYVNPLEQGDLWRSPEDLPGVFPGLYLLQGDPPNLNLESLDGQWHLVIGDDRGRLHVSLQHGKKSSPHEAPEVMVLQLTARGPLDDDHMDIWSGFDLGHEAIVRCFTAMTSEEAHQHWQRRT